MNPSDEIIGNSKIMEWLVCDSIGILMINNVPRNSIEEPEFVDLTILKQWTSDKSLKGLIITGKGRHFSAGANVDIIYEKIANQKTMERDLKKGREILDHIGRLSIPTVAAITGVCFGAGLEIALSCYLRVCSENALFAFPEANLELMPGFTGSIRLPQKIGTGKSIEIILSGEPVNAQKALELGIVDYVVPKNKALEYSINLLKKMTDNKPSHVIHAIITSLNNSRYLPPEQAMEEEARLFCQLALKAVEQKERLNNNL
jgi:enoyl-CoA hydratase